MNASVVDELRVGVAPIESLRPSDENPRRIAPARLAQLKRSLEADPLMLRARPIIALPNGTIVAGNMRWRAARELGWTEVPCVIVDLDRERARLWMLRDNSNAGEWDQASLSLLLAEMNESVDLDLAGFDERELSRLLDEFDHDTTTQLPPMTYSILIDCESERAQIEIATRLEAEGLQVKLLMA